MTALAIDIGGTKFAAALVRPDGTVARRAELPVGPDPEATLASLVRHIRDTGTEDTSGSGAGEDLGDLAGVGIGSAGPLDAVAGTVSPVNIPAWREFPLVGAVSELLPGLPVTLAGDAQCMALGEWWRGGHSGSRALLGIVVSTGVGGGLVLDGVPYVGPTGNAGHIGHISVDRDGELCPCGAIGCLETISSGPSMVRWALANGWSAPEGAHPDARALSADAARGVPVAQLAFQRAADALAVAILSTAALFDLDDVVIGGGVSGAGETLLAPLRQAVAKRAGLGFLRGLKVERTSLERDAGLYGAAALVLPVAG